MAEGGAVVPKANTELPSPNDEPGCEGWRVVEAGEEATEPN